MFAEKLRWDIIMHLSTAGDVNKAIIGGHASELIQVSEALQEKKIVKIAEDIDERFRRYGYEDVLFGKRLKQGGISITHIENPLGFNTFEPNQQFLRKTEEALTTLHDFRDDLRGYSQMLTLTEGIHVGFVKSLIRLWHRLAGPMERRNLCGRHPNLTVFKLYKIGYYLSIKN